MDSLQFLERGGLKLHQLSFINAPSAVCFSAGLQPKKRQLHMLLTFTSTPIQQFTFKDTKVLVKSKYILVKPTLLCWTVILNCLATWQGSAGWLITAQSCQGASASTTISWSKAQRVGTIINDKSSNSMLCCETCNPLHTPQRWHGKCLLKKQKSCDQPLFWLWLQ